MSKSELLQKIQGYRCTPQKELIDKRLQEFQSFESKSKKEWFSELCFCILTANAKSRTAIQIQEKLGGDGFLNLTFEQLRDTIVENKHRFHNNKAKFIVEARKHKDIKKILSSMKASVEKREWIAGNVKGISFKEASHFLRNTGTTDVAIIDRHVINTLVEHNIIKKPKTVNKKTYLKIELLLDKIAQELSMNQAELDMYLFSMKTKEVLK